MAQMNRTFDGKQERKTIFRAGQPRYMCEVQGCQEPARYRASWLQGIVVKLVCAAHKTEVEGKLFEELGPSKFGRTRDLTYADPLSLLG